MNETRNCAEDGKQFTPRKLWALFCCTGCQKRFHRLMEKRGDVLTPLLIAASEARRYGDARDPDLAAYARREADALISAWVVEDRRDGRDCASVARLKRDRGWRAIDVLASRSGPDRDAA